jgi:hypothetical protein
VQLRNEENHVSIALRLELEGWRARLESELALLRHSGSATHEPVERLRRELDMVLRELDGAAAPSSPTD